MTNKFCSFNAYQIKTSAVIYGAAKWFEHFQLIFQVSVLTRLCGLLQTSSLGFDLCVKCRWRAFIRTLSYMAAGCLSV